MRCSQAVSWSFISAIPLSKTNSNFAPMAPRTKTSAQRSECNFVPLHPPSLSSPSNVRTHRRAAPTPPLGTLSLSRSVYSLSRTKSAASSSPSPSLPASPPPPPSPAVSRVFSAAMMSARLRLNRELRPWQELPPAAASRPRPSAKSRMSSEWPREERCVRF